MRVSNVDSPHIYLDMDDSICFSWCQLHPFVIVRVNFHGQGTYNYISSTSFHDFNGIDIPVNTPLPDYVLGNLYTPTQ
jgi:hypothetical protein